MFFMYAVFKVQLTSERKITDKCWKLASISLYLIFYARHVSVVTEQALLVRFAHNIYTDVYIIFTDVFDILHGLSHKNPLGLSGLEPPTSRLSGVRSNQLSYKPFLIWRPPALPHRLQCSTIGRLGLNRRVRDGYGCFPQTHRHQKSFSYSVTS